jgi:hypothetical protein
MPVFIAKADWIVTPNNDVGISDNISVYPNPATEKINITVHGGNTKGLVEIGNIEGVNILQREIFGSTAIVDISGLPKGFYFIRITGVKSVLVARFLKRQ